METTKRILKMVLKDFSINYTITFLAKEIGVSRVGVWKTVKKLQNEKRVLLTPIGMGTTSVCTVHLNWRNPLVEKILSVALTEDALKQQRWISNFGELENKVDFLILYGSILHSPKEANDIDVLVISDKKNFAEIEEVIDEAQNTQVKKIHVLCFTTKEFKEELEKPNKVFIDGVKKGIVLFGQEKFIKFIKGLQK